MVGKLKVFFLCLCLANCSYNSFAQTAVPATDSSKPKIIKPPPPLVFQKPIVKKIKPISKEFSGGLRINSDGYSIFFDKGIVEAEDSRRSDMFYDIKLWQFEFSEKKNPQETKSTNTGVDPFSGSGKSTYIFGKVNNFYTLKVGYGIRRMIAGKPDPGCVSIHWTNMFGVGLGMLKPYYLNVSTESDPIKYSDANSSEFLSKTNIVGYAGFSKGLTELKFVPGLHAKTGLHFDFSNSRKTLLAAEIGIDAEIYTQKIQLMALTKATPYFLNIYGSFQFGKRW